MEFVLQLDEEVKAMQMSVVHLDLQLKEHWRSLDPRPGVEASIYVYVGGVRVNLCGY